MDKQKTNYLFLVFVVLLCVWVLLYIKNQSRINVVNLETSYSNKSNIKNSNDNLHEYVDDIYKIKFSYLNDSISIHDEKDEKNNRNFYLATKIINKNQPMSISINLLKNENENKIPIETWWSSNGFNTEKQGPEPYKKENLKIDDQEAIKLYFSSSSFGGGNYGPIIYYISRGTDIYEIWGTHLLDSSSASQADIQSAHEYEQIFYQILTSLKFVE